MLQEDWQMFHGAPTYCMETGKYSTEPLNIASGLVNVLRRWYILHRDWQMFDES